MSVKDDVVAVDRIVKRIRPLLAGRPPEIQIAVLTDCVALWMAGHYVEGDAAETHAMREDFLAEFCQGVRVLIPALALQMGTTP